MPTRRQLLRGSAGLAGSLLVPPRAAAREGSPDIIVILTDDMRGADWPELSETRRLVGGTEFANFVYSTPLCAPSRATLLTGCHAHTTGVMTNHPGWQAFRDNEAQTLPVALHDAGYHTIMVGKYMNGRTGKAVPPGWDVWHHDGSKGRFHGDQTDRMRDQAIAALAAAPPETPRFLMLSVHSPHTPPHPAKRHLSADVGPTVNKFDRKRKQSLLAVDEAVVAIAEAMGPRWESASVFVLSDNGFLINEHGTTGKSHWWDGTLRVPMVARCSGLGQGTSNAVVSTPDVMPTILEAVGVSVPWAMEGVPMQRGGHDGVLVESWERKSMGHKRLPFTGIRTRDWTYVEPQGKPPALYTVADGETVNHLDSPDDPRGSDAWAAWLAELRESQPVSARHATADHGGDHQKKGRHKKR